MVKNPLSPSASIRRFLQKYSLVIADLTDPPYCKYRYSIHMEMTEKTHWSESATHHHAHNIDQQRSR